MPTPYQLDTFTLMFHRQALIRIREEPALLARALDTLDRWKLQRGETASEPYLILQQGVDAIQTRVCSDTAEAATLRNVSPLGFVLSSAQRLALREQAMR
jgi:hypothetical protein